MIEKLSWNPLKIFRTDGLTNSSLFWIAGALALAAGLSARPALAADSDDNAAAAGDFR